MSISIDVLTLGQKSEGPLEAIHKGASKEFNKVISAVHVILYKLQQSRFYQAF